MDVQDSDPGDFRRWRAVDTSTYYWLALGHNCQIIYDVKFPRHNRTCICLGNDLLQIGIKPLPEPMMAEFYM